MHARVDVGHADQHADAAVGQLLGPLDLVEIFRGVVVDGGPEQIAQVGEAVGGGKGGLRLDGGKFRVGSRQENRAEIRARSWRRGPRQQD